MLRDMELFVAVARAQSFTRAARALAVPTSTLSRRIGALESSLGARLFERTTRRVALTQAGALYLSKCEAVVETAREADEAVRRLAGSPSGLLRISLEAEVGPTLVAPAVAAFLARFPAVRIELDLSPRRVDLSGEGFDLAIRLGRLPDSTLTVRRLAQLRVGLFASPEYLDRHGVPVTPADLDGLARLHLLHQGDRAEWELTGPAGERSVVASGGPVAANNMTMVRALARLHLGIAVLDEIAAGEDVTAGMLRPVLPGWTLPGVAVSALTPARGSPAKTRLFVEMLVGSISSR